MRIACFFLFFGIFLAPLRAQEQERKLVDRLLKPDLTLQNADQNKKFTFKKETQTPVRAKTKSFYVPEKSQPKLFAGTRTAETKEFAANNYREGNLKSHATSSFASERKTFTTDNADVVRQANESDHSVSTSQFQGSRSFLAQGKSQKALDRKNPPLTIDEVRELLNKNK